MVRQALAGQGPLMIFGPVKWRETARQTLTLAERDLLAAAGVILSGRDTAERAARWHVRLLPPGDPGLRHSGAGTANSPFTLDWRALQARPAGAVPGDSGRRDAPAGGGFAALWLEEARALGDPRRWRDHGGHALPSFGGIAMLILSLAHLVGALAMDP